MRRIDVYDGMDVEIDRNVRRSPLLPALPLHSAALACFRVLDHSVASAPSGPRLLACGKRDCHCVAASAEHRCEWLQGKQYIQTPRMDKFVCRLAGAEAEGVGASADAEPAASGSTRRLLAESDAPERPRGTSSYDAALHALKHDQAQRGAGKGPKPKQYGGLPTLDGFTFEKDVDFNNIKAEKWTYKLKARPRRHRICQCSTCGTRHHAPSEMCRSRTPWAITSTS